MLLHLGDICQCVYLKYCDFSSLIFFLTQVASARLAFSGEKLRRSRETMKYSTSWHRVILAKFIAGYLTFFSADTSHDRFGARLREPGVARNAMTGEDEWNCVKVITRFRVPLRTLIL